MSKKRTTEKNLMVFSGRAHPELAEEVVGWLGIGLVPTSAYEFANSEIYVRFEESVRGCDAFVIQSHTAPINEWIMEHLIMVDALKRAAPSGSPWSCRSTATPARTRSTAAASRSRRG